MKCDECPHLILGVAYVSKEAKQCCSRYLAEVAGQWGTDPKKLRFTWHLSTGQIIKGQGTSVITIDTRQAKETLIEIKVKVDGLDAWHPVCAKEVSMTIDRCKDKEKSAAT